MSETVSTEDLDNALRQSGLVIEARYVEPLAQYCQLLWKLNRQLNLTRHTDYQVFVARDIVDSLQLSTLVHPGERVLDIGSGGGVPGVVLCILRPDVDVTLCESVGKRQDALQLICNELRL
ncbi:MAG: 16S rRNA (guanine(527)-N(7))-methyltransferase RsmG, partial [Burkholderiales bacterium]|nr:16S rRNA (guanine(527)-N(7))-methyltransferase RsmG [Burkholderiales bacterium]